MNPLKEHSQTRDHVENDKHKTFCVSITTGSLFFHHCHMFKGKKVHAEIQSIS